MPDDRCPSSRSACSAPLSASGPGMPSEGCVRAERFPCGPRPAAHESPAVGSSLIRSRPERRRQATNGSEDPRRESRAARERNVTPGAATCNDQRMPPRRRPGSCPAPGLLRPLRRSPRAGLPDDGALANDTPRGGEPGGSSPEGTRGDETRLPARLDSWSAETRVLDEQACQRTLGASLFLPGTCGTPASPCLRAVTAKGVLPGFPTRPEFRLDDVQQPALVQWCGRNLGGSEVTATDMVGVQDRGIVRERQQEPGPRGFPPRPARRETDMGRLAHTEATNAGFGQ